jgi:hypothetical protein
MVQLDQDPQSTKRIGMRIVSSYKIIQNSDPRSPKNFKISYHNTKLLLFERPVLEKISISYGLADVYLQLECRL